MPRFFFVGSTKNKGDAGFWVGSAKAKGHFREKKQKTKKGVDAPRVPSWTVKGAVQHLAHRPEVAAPPGGSRGPGLSASPREAPTVDGQNPLHHKRKI